MLHLSEKVEWWMQLTYGITTPVVLDGQPCWRIRDNRLKKMRLVFMISGECQCVAVIETYNPDTRDWHCITAYAGTAHCMQWGVPLSQRITHGYISVDDEKGCFEYTPIRAKSARK